MWFLCNILPPQSGLGYLYCRRYMGNVEHIYCTVLQSCSLSLRSCLRCVHMVQDALDATSKPAGVWMCVFLHTHFSVPLRAHRSVFLPLWNSVDYSGEAWREAQPSEDEEEEEEEEDEGCGRVFIAQGQKASVHIDRFTCKSPFLIFSLLKCACCMLEKFGFGFNE